MAYVVQDYIHEPLYVITPIFNPIRYKSRWKHYERFAKHVKDSGGVLITVEAAFGERHHALDAGVTQYDTLIHQLAPVKATEFHKARTTEAHQYIKVVTNDIFFVKENLIDIGASYLPADAKYVAWIDADVMFSRPNWVTETIHQLQVYKFVQMFSHAHDLDSNYDKIQEHRSFMDCYLQGVLASTRLKGGYYGAGGYGGGKLATVNLWHPGFAWAARRDALDAVGGMVDFSILGAADNHMAHALVGCVEESIHPGMHPRYRERLLEWEAQAEAKIRRQVGVVSGLLLHNWHGPKADRRYWDRWKILVDNGFNPDVDINYDSQGMLQLVDRGTLRSIQLRDDIVRYFQARNEDMPSQ